MCVATDNDRRSAGQQSAGYNVIAAASDNNMLGTVTDTVEGCNVSTSVSTRQCAS